MSTMAKMSWNVEHVYWLSQLLSLVMIGLTVVLGGVALFTGKVINARQSEKLLRLEAQLADAKKKEAEAQLSLLRLSRFVREPRTVDREKSKTLLGGRPKGSVEIKYIEENVEAERFAYELQKNLNANGWVVSSMTKVGADVIRHAGIALKTGSVLTGKPGNFGPEFEEPGETLNTFLQTCVTGSTEGWMTTDTRLPKDASVVLIGPKVW